MPGDAPAWIGNPAIRDGFAQFPFEQGPGGQLGSRQSEDLVDEAIVCSQDCLFARGTWREEFTPQDGSELLRYAGKWVWLIRRQPDGNWKIVWQIWNRDAPIGQ